MAFDILGYLLELPKSILPISHLLRRLIYTITSAFVQCRGQHNIDELRFFTHLFRFRNRTYTVPCEYNAYAIAMVATCSSHRPVLVDRNDGYAQAISALAKDPISHSAKKQVPKPELAEMPFEQAEASLVTLRTEEVPFVSDIQAILPYFHPAAL
jgi:hypothetical protein